MTLRERRKALGLTQAQLAKLVGVTSMTVSFWESGENKPSFQKATVLSQVFHCCVDDIDRGLSSLEPGTIKWWRKKIGLTASQLASRAGVSADLVNDWEHDRLAPHPDHLRLLAEAFGCRPEEIVIRAERKKRNITGHCVETPKIPPVVMEQLVAQNLDTIDFVVNEGRRYIHASKIEYEDMRQELAAVLVRAIQLYQPNEKATLRTYIGKSLRRALPRITAEYGRRGMTGVPKDGWPHICSLNQLQEDFGFDIEG